MKKTLIKFTLTLCFLLANPAQAQDKPLILNEADGIMYSGASQRA